MIYYMNMGVFDMRAGQSHRIPSYQQNQLFEQHLNKKHYGTRYYAPSSIRILFLLSVYILNYTCTDAKIAV